MRFATIDGRGHLQVGPDEYVDIETASGGRLPSDPMSCIERWPDLRQWFDSEEHTFGAVVHASPAELGPPVPAPSQIFAVGLNYALHVAETGLAGDASAPLTFTKFASSITGPQTELTLPTDTVDWEVELVAVVGRSAHQVPVEQAWSVLAGVTLGQDLSERTSQMAGTPPQFSLGKSYPGFTPLGPVVVSLDELDDVDDVALECRLNDEIVQSASTRQMIHSIPQLVAHYSSVCTLRPGDLIFTGTPDGVGMGRVPPVYLRDGDELVSSSPQIGLLRQSCRRLSLLDDTEGSARA